VGVKVDADAVVTAVGMTARANRNKKVLPLMNA
jgi:hypothetical protein